MEEESARNANLTYIECHLAQQAADTLATAFGAPGVSKYTELHYELALLTRIYDQYLYLNSAREPR